MDVFGNTMDKAIFLVWTIRVSEGVTVNWTPPGKEQVASLKMERDKFAEQHPYLLLQSSQVKSESECEYFSHNHRGYINYLSLTPLGIVHWSQCYHRLQRIEFSTICDLLTLGKRT
jgi:hypothetical protein